MKRLFPFLLVVPLIAALSTAQPAEPFDLLLVGGRLLDGSGNPWVYADVGIRGDRIVFVGNSTRPATPAAAETIDVSGQFVAPGFIDLHTHAGERLDDAELRHALPYLHEGVTTIVTGNDGSSPWPIGETLDRWNRQGLGVNTALLAGHGTIRSKVLGSRAVAPAADQLDQMKALLGQALDQGAFGLSTGLFYAPGSYATTDEVIELARVVARQGGYYDSHIRDEGSYTVGVLAAIDEVIRIGRSASLPVHVSHIKALGKDVWGKAPQIVNRINAARREGIDITADQYPYTASSTGLGAALVPRWAQEGGTAEFRKRLADSETRARIRREMEANLERRGGPRSLVIASTARHELEGKSLELIGHAWGLAPLDAALKILETADASVVSFNMSEEDLVVLMRQEWVATASDGSLVTFGAGKPHPRGYGAFPRKIERYVRQQGVLTLPDAVRTATSLPASVLRLQDRGWVKPGQYADVIVFGEDFSEKSTFEEPHQYAAGLRYAIVNGQVAIRDGTPTKKLAGRALKRN